MSSNRFAKPSPDASAACGLNSLASGGRMGPKIPVADAPDVRSLRILVIGCGSVTQAVLPLLIRDLGVDPCNIVVYAASSHGTKVANRLGVTTRIKKITRSNYLRVIFGVSDEAGTASERSAPFDVLLNLSVNVGSVDLAEACQRFGVLYLDTCIEPWFGGYDAQKIPEELTTNYSLRRKALQLSGEGSPTAVMAHGANPGLVSHFVREALFSLARDKGLDCEVPSFAHLAQMLGVKVIQVAERDTQCGFRDIKEGEFVSTWSSHGFLSELGQQCEAGWGTHERSVDVGPESFSVVWKNDTNALTWVKSWTPFSQETQSLLITHNESLSICEMLSVANEVGEIVYRPTVYYAYRPGDLTMDSIGQWLRNGKQSPSSPFVLAPDVLDGGADELGVLLCMEGGAYWYGSTLALERARTLAPFNSATSLQVAAGVLGALVWMLENPMRGVVEAESMCSDRVMQVARPYLGDLIGVHTSWAPGDGLQFEQFFLRMGQ